MVNAITYETAITLISDSSNLRQIMKVRFRNVGFSDVA
jgi:hypothetical protein